MALRIVSIDETDRAYRSAQEFDADYAATRLAELSPRLDHVALLRLDRESGDAAFVTTSGGAWPNDDERHLAQAAFVVTFTGVRDEHPEELADLAAAAAFEWEHEVVLDDTVGYDFHLVGQLWTALMPLLWKERPERAKALKVRVVRVQIESMIYRERSPKEKIHPRAPYLQMTTEKFVISFNRQANEDQIMDALRAAQTYAAESQ